MSLPATPPVSSTAVTAAALVLSSTSDAWALGSVTSMSTATVSRSGRRRGLPGSLHRELGRRALRTAAAATAALDAVVDHRQPERRLPRRPAPPRPRPPRHPHGPLLHRPRPSPTGSRAHRRTRSTAPPVQTFPTRPGSSCPVGSAGRGAAPPARRRRRSGRRAPRESGWGSASGGATRPCRSSSARFSAILSGLPETVPRGSSRSGSPTWNTPARAPISMGAPPRSSWRSSRS